MYLTITRPVPQTTQITQSPHLKTPSPGFNPGFTPFYITNVGDELRVKPGVWRPEMWAQEKKIELTYAIWWIKNLLLLKTRQQT
jgi:hypothetical protein